MIVVPMHGLGGARDLPIPASLAISAAVAALVISFTVLILAWRTPRYDARTQGRPLPDGFARLRRRRSPALDPARARAGRCSPTSAGRWSPDPTW